MSCFLNPLVFGLEEQDDSGTSNIINKLVASKTAKRGSFLNTTDRNTSNVKIKKDPVIVITDYEKLTEDDLRKEKKREALRLEEKNKMDLSLHELSVNIDVSTEKSKPDKLNVMSEGSGDGIVDDEVEGEDLTPSPESVKNNSELKIQFEKIEYLLKGIIERLIYSIFASVSRYFLIEGAICLTGKHNSDESFSAASINPNLPKVNSGRKKSSFSLYSLFEKILVIEDDPIYPPISMDHIINIS
ncbi:hypothetical protein AYI70_g11391 [Smittium culicis]|uniref:Uncharacterized protein n=1 Tax=Smittium culicis TaxID=133412 RepID=A0A1R1X221_9FUNG|nr:hypothetical protein AYI70_g11391 [Smittium culicis]